MAADSLVDLNFRHERILKCHSSLPQYPPATGHGSHFYHQAAWAPCIAIRLCVQLPLGGVASQEHYLSSISNAES